VNDLRHWLPCAERESSNPKCEILLTDISYSYKPDVRLRFVTEELGFESDEEACQFIIDHAPEESSILLEERDGDVRFLTGKAGSIFHLAKTKAFGQIDIKGQI
jgi:SAC3 family protein LENG8/THP3